MQGPERFVAFRAPSVRTSCVGIVAPVESDSLSAIHCVRDVGANQTDPLLAVNAAIDGIHVERDAGERLKLTCSGQRAKDSMEVRLRGCPLSGGVPCWAFLT
jgi:hypothetical protein